MRIAHTADIHIRGQARHQEYDEQLQLFVNDLKTQNIDVLVIAGDTFHSKISGLTPEYIELFVKFLRNLSEAVPLTYITLGNHDGNLSNTTRLDSVSPIVNAVNLKNVICCKNSGVYKLPYGNLIVYSLFDKLNWPTLQPLPNQFNIATYHGALSGAVTDDGWVIDHGDISLEHFAGYNLLLLGDIHKRQIFERSGAPWGAYPGSLIQQNFGEDISKGYLIWTIENNISTVEYREIQNSKPFITLTTADLNSKFLGDSYNPKIKLLTSTFEKNELPKVILDLKSRGASEVSVKFNDIKFELNEKIDKVDTSVNLTAKDLLDLAITSGFKFDDYEFALSTLSNALKDAKSTIPEQNKWSLRALSFDNVFCYGENNLIHFEDKKGIIGVFGTNGIGKSSLLGALTYVLFNEADRDKCRNIAIVNKQSNFCSGIAIIDVNSVTYSIERLTTKSTKKDGSLTSQTNLNIFKYVNGDKIDLCGEQRSDTEKILRSLIGDSDNSKMANIATQGNIARFIDDGSSGRRVALLKTMGLSYFDDLFKILHDSNSQYKVQLKQIQNIDYDSEIKNLEESLNNFQSQLGTSELNRTDLMNQRQNYEFALTQIKAIEPLINKQNKLKLNIENIKKQLSKLDFNFRSRSDVTKEIENAILDAQNKSTSQIYESQLSQKKSKLLSTQKSLKILQNVPCSGSFGSCQFIKDAVELSKTFDSEIDNFKTFMNNKPIYNAYNGKSLSQLQEELRSIEAMEKVNGEKTILEEKLQLFNDELKEIHIPELDFSIENKIRVIDKSIKDLDDNLFSLRRKIDSNTITIQRLKTDQINRVSILNNMKNIEQLEYAFSKKGIPLILLKQHLDFINLSVNKLLQSSVGLTVKSFIDGDDLQIEIFNGNQTIPIELACGMEKFFTALAFRMVMAKLSPTSSDFFIIDEGFGVLDDNNIENACKLLTNAKSMFNFMLIVSHVDYVKDIADHVLEITTDESGRSKL